MRDACLGDVVVSMKNGLYKPASEYVEDGTPCLRMYNIDAGSIVWRDIKRMRVSAAELEEYGLRQGDLLVNRVNSRELVGKAAFIPPSLEPSVFESKNIRVRLDASKALPKFINYQLLAGGRSHFAGNAQQVVGMASISQKQLADFPIVLADLDEQRRIVAELEKQFSRLDEAVANLKRVKANLKRYKTAVLDAAVNGRIGIEDAASGAGLPAGWQWSSVGELATVGTGATPARSNEAFWGGTIPWITSSAVNEPFVDAADQFVTAEALRQTNLTLYPSGTLLVAMYGEGKTRGKCSELRIAATTNQALATLQVDPAVRPWLKLFLEHNYDNTRRIASGGVQPNLNLGLIRSIGLPLPPVNEQHRIVAEVDRRLSIAREIGTEIDASLARAQALRTATLTRAFFQPPECHDSRGSDET